MQRDDDELCQNGFVKCKNLCNALLEWWFDCKRVCIHCDMFGTLERIDPVECPIHLENRWTDKKIENYENEMHLRTCPLCRS
jgi:hypothetical protein